MDKDIRKTYHFGERIKKDETNKLGWKDINLDDIDITKPAIFCFGGNGTVENLQANGNAKYIEAVLNEEVKKHNIPIYSIVYGSKPLDTTGTLTYGELEEIAKILFVKRVCDKNGKKLSVKQAQKNIRNLNITTHCYGQNVVKEMLAFSANYMEYNLFYKPNEIIKILNQTLVVSYAPMSKSSALSTNFEFCSLSDNTSSYIKQLKKENNQNLSKNTAILKTDANTATFIAKSFVNENSNEDEHLMSNIVKTKNTSLIANNVLNAYSTVLCDGVLNSIENLESEKFLPLKKSKEIANLIDLNLTNTSENIKKENKTGTQAKVNTKIMHV